MKQKAALLFVACAFLLAIVMSGGLHVNSRAVVLGINHSSTNTALSADGGLPTPPLPPPSGLSSHPTLSADGGLPTPPLPPPSGLSSYPTLSADGGLPTPPLPPPSGVQVVASTPTV